MKKIVLTGGGTAGHVNPNIALIPHLLADGWEIHYIGSVDGIERQLMQPFTQIPYHTVQVGKLRRYMSAKNLSDPFKVLKGRSEARAILQQLQPQVIFSKGGFVSVPVVYGAKDIPVVLHESDYSCGLANKLCARRAKTVCVSFEPTLADVGAKGVWTGSPIRSEIINGDASRAMEFTSLDDSKQWLLFIGGSQGSVAINKCVTAALPQLLERFHVVHIRGKGNLDESLSGLPDYRQYEYLQEQLPDIYAASSLVVGRAGANTLFELLAAKKPMLLIPLPKAQSRGDQILNAKYFETLGYASMLQQEDMTQQSLLESIEQTLLRREDMMQAMASSPMQNGTDNVLKQIYLAAGMA
ncbi:undecaprenyldiphospho-muramoylpentapeptide beta-N-acetylglucosaminyltransferase [Eubacteriales bacterium OttesenSCG-928-N14]|nr:undecaprenyldiphospho-muramoylpentapeptide beta-N-acetylglucosaminyltransferase [Eubacteriales bacterium OttesenSCG-928-N14]